MQTLSFFGVTGVTFDEMLAYFQSIGCVLWLDATDSGSIGISNPSTRAIQEWRDKSGNSNHFSQTTGSSQPFSLNNTVSFTSSRFLSNSTRQIFPSSSSTGSMFLVGRQPNVDGAGWGRMPNINIVNNTPTTNGNTFRGNFLNSNSVDITITGRTATIPLPRTIINFDHTGQTLTLRENGAINLPPQTLTGTVNFQRPTTTQQRLGGATGDFDIDEILMFPRVLTTDERQIVEGYLAHKNLLTGLLPSAHPYKDSLSLAFPNTSFISIQSNEAFWPTSS